MSIVYSQSNRSERLIAAGRMILVTFAFFEIWLDHTGSAGHIGAGYFLITGCLCYSIILVWASWRTDLAWTDSALIHALDLMIFTVLIFLTSAPASPFFVFFAFFLLVSATLRWQWRGIICTAVIILGVKTALVLYTADLSQSAKYDIDHFICGIIYLLVAAVLLGCLGSYQQKQRGKISELAAWPRTLPEEIYPLVSEILQRSSSILDSPRTLLLWSEKEEPLLHVASWSGDQFHHSIESSDTFGTMVAESMAGKNFFCRNSLAKKPLVVQSSANGVEQWRGIPIDSELQRRFSIKSVISLALDSERVSGRLLALDKEYMTSDDLELGKIVSREASYNLDQFHLQEQLRQTTAMEERIRLSRDLHDGLLQTLTGAVMQLDTARQMMEKDPKAARQQLLDIQEQISDEQQNLRSSIRELKSTSSGLPEANGDLSRRLKELTERIGRQWGLDVDIGVELNLSGLQSAMARGVYFIMREAIINAARHSGASNIQAEITSTDHHMQIIVTDNGQGFPFAGRYDHEALTGMNLGPVILRERVTSLGGRLAIETGETGSRLEITLPIPEKNC